jgi:transcriptional regulator with PAS, ATPase and Fis domain
MQENRKKEILIVSMRKMPAERLKQSLNDIFADALEVNTHAYLEQGSLTLSTSPKLILASGENSFKRANISHPGENILLAKRDVSLPVFFERVFLLPKGKKVLVINETRDGTLDTIQNLVNIGIDYLTFIPYWQDSDLEVDSDVDTAISPGMLHICPERIATKIDIGMRQLSISVFIKILLELDLDLNYTEKFLSYNKKLLVDSYKRLSEQCSRSEELHTSLESILNNINEAIIAVEDTYISECNPAAEKLLGFAKNEVLWKNINSVMGEAFGESYNNVFLFNNKKVFVTYIALQSATKKGIITFKEISEIEEMEEKVRKILYKKDSGYTAKYAFKDILAKSENMQKLTALAHSMAQSDSSILITGESGTGKELFAQAIHNASPRKKGPFIAVNFGAIPDNLIESELFGYEEGAFTGAKRSGKKGLFEVAHNGTLFLDEIGNSSTWIQSRLLRVLEEKELMRLGDTKVIPVNVRVIVASNQNLRDLINQKLFREDLYYRLNVFPLKIPPLRERKECIVSLIQNFMIKYNLNKKFSEESHNCIMNYDWPGNVRELKNMIDFVALQRNKPLIELEDLPYDMQCKAPENLSLSNQDISSILLRLQSLGDLSLIKDILNTFKKNSSTIGKIGRNRMQKELENNGIALSDGKIRTIMDHMGILGLVSTGKTKQGTVISQKGEQILEAIHKFSRL